MKIVLFSSSWCAGGIESFLINILHSIDNKGLEFAIISGQKETNIYDAFFNRKGISTFYLGRSILASPYLRELRTIIKAKKAFKKSSPDIIHINAHNSTGFVYAYIAKKANISRVIVHSHCSGIKDDNLGVKSFVHKALKCLEKYSDYNIACSEAAGTFLFTGNYHIINNGINTETFKFFEPSRIHQRKALNYNSNDLVIGHIGRFSVEKNQGFIIDIFSELRKKDNRYKLLLLGDGELKNSIQAKVENAGLTDYITFTGNVNNVQDYMQAMDLFILPSLFEGLGIVGIEAQACGLPCVFSTGVPDEAKLTDNVEFVSLEDKDKWIDTIEKMISLPKSENTAQIRAAGYDIRETAKKLEEIYLGK